VEAREFPKRLRITVVADEHVLGTFQERVSSWFSDGTEVQVTVTSEVDEAQLLASSPSEVRAWIVPLSAERALLTFSSVTPPALPRHLVREVRLHEGFDELGLERLASVTHSAFVALREGVEGVERAQAERELGAVGVSAGSVATPSASATPQPTPAATTPAVPSAKPNPAPIDRVAEPSAWLLVAAGYGMRLRGPEGVGHGPSLGLGLQLRKGRTLFDFQLSGQYLFRTEFAAAPFAASVQTTALRVQLGGEPQLRSSLYAQALLGIGTDLARISASTADGSTGNTRPREDGTQWRGVGELTLGILRRGELLDVGLYAHVDFVFGDIHYSAATSNGDEALLVSPWRVQPALSLQGRFRSAL